MVIRIIVKSRGGFPNGTVSDPTYRTFDIEDKSLEQYLTETRRPDDREVVGAEVMVAEAGGDNENRNQNKNNTQ